MTRLERIVVTILALSGAGSILGALVGAVALTVSLIISGDRHPEAGPVLGSILGAALGAFTAPTVAWLLLRRVPLGRMLLGCSAGTMTGGILGWATAAEFVAPLGGLAGAFIGCLAAALILRHRALPRLALHD